MKRLTNEMITKFIEKIIDKTKNEELNWERSSTHKYADLISNSDKIIRLIDTKISNNEVLVLTEKIVIRNNMELGKYEDTFIQMYIISTSPYSIAFESYYVEDYYDELIDLITLVDKNKALDIFEQVINS